MIFHVLTQAFFLILIPMTNKLVNIIINAS